MPALPFRPSLSQIKKQAKTLRKECQSGQSEAQERVRDHHPDYAGASLDDIRTVDLSLRDAQLVVAREYGTDNWAALKKKVEDEAGKTNREEIAARRIKEQTSSHEEIERVVQAACGSSVRRQERNTRGFSCEVRWITTVDGRELMYRANWYNPADDPHFENEKWALQRCAEAGIPAPRFLYSEHGLPGHPYRSVCLTTRVQGSSLKQLLDEGTLAEADLPLLLIEAGALLGKIHQIPTWGFGPLDVQGRGTAPDWHSAHLDNIDLERLRWAADNTGLPWALVDEGLELLQDRAHLGDGVQPHLLHGEFDLEHIIVDNGRVSGLVDFEYCSGGDPADEAGWSGEPAEEGWWEAFTGEKSPSWSTAPLLEGYRQTGKPDGRFLERGRWLKFSRCLGGLSYHGVHDINTAGMMDFLNWRYRQDLDQARRYLG